MPRPKKKTPDSALEVVRVALDDLTPDPENPRKHSNRNLEAIRASLKAHGQVAPLVVQKGTGTIIGGNATAASLAAIGETSAEVVFIECDEAERRQLAVRLNRTAELAEWDTSILGSYLAELGDGAAAFGFDSDEVDAFVDAFNPEPEPEPDDPYTAKVEAPIYEVTGECPAVGDLYDNARTVQLVKEIEQADIDDEVRAFLLEAAGRHTAFRYDRIAEYYAHASAPVQKLMEDSALVIIDFEKAIELGFVKLTQELCDAYLDDHSETATQEYGPLLTRSRADTLNDLIRRAGALGYDGATIRALTDGYDPEGPLFDRWYESLERGDPDYSVYMEPVYFAEALFCWNDYSRGYLRALHKNGVVSDLSDVDVVVDLGCGLGLTTAALAEAFPSAKVYGTNLPGSIQYEIARSLSTEHGFEIVENLRDIPSGGRTLVFASEYFEHFPSPVEHLRDVLEILDPSALVVANTFTGDAIGHFQSYLDGGTTIGRKAIGRLFGRELRGRGYTATWGGWNNKPRLWKNDER